MWEISRVYALINHDQNLQPAWMRIGFQGPALAASSHSMSSFRRRRCLSPGWPRPTISMQELIQHGKHQEDQRRRGEHPAHDDSRQGLLRLRPDTGGNGRGQKSDGRRQ